MAHNGELLTRILSAGGSRGLSRDVEPVLSADPRVAFFSSALRRHRVPGDLVADPNRVWSADGGDRAGLRGHLLGERGTGVLGFSDLLLIINSADWRRSLRDVRVPWVERAATVLADQVDAFCRAEGLTRVFPERPVGFRILQDGGPEMHGASIGLGEGEVVTGVLPGLHTGRVAGSRPVVAVHLNLPGHWAGYREVGVLHSDQLLLTIGSHWLDGFSHPALEVPALYRLHHDGQGGFLHVISPEVKDGYRIREHPSGAGPSVLRIERADGSVLAWMLLQLADEDAVPVPAPPRSDALAMGEQSAAAHGAPEPGPGLAAGRSVVPQGVDGRLVTLRETGALLQKVHFARFMEGYDVYLDHGGYVSTDAPCPAATLHVRGRQVSLEAHVGGVGLDGVALAPEAPVFVSGDGRITVGEAVLEWKDLSGVRAPGWPYLGELRRVGATSHVVEGQSHRIGRDSRCTVRLPDEPHNDNIVWRPELREGGSIRSRNGEIPKSRFYIDSIMVASEHAELDLTSAPILRSLARDCYTYVRRGREVLPLHPQRRKGGPLECELVDGDEILVGNCAFRISWAAPEAVASEVFVTSEELVAALDVTEPAAPRAAVVAAARAAVVVEEEEESPVPSAPADLGDPYGLPPAAGLGERGGAPPPLPFGEGPDALLRGSGDTIDALDVPTTPATPRSALGLPGSDAASSGATDALDAPTRPGSGPLDLLDAPTRPSTGAVDVLDAPTRPAFSTGRAHLAAGPGAGGQHAPAALGATDDPTAVPAGRAPPPVAVDASADSLLGDLDDPMPSAMGLGRTSPDAGPTDETGVLTVDEAAWQHELSRPARLVLRGWMVSGTVVVGNHADADVVLPENRSEAEQVFRASDYLELYVRGRRGQFRTLSPDAIATVAGETRAEGDDVDGLSVSVTRRDVDGAPDFDITLEVVDDPGLPDPRARLLRLDRADRMASALFTLGLPFRQARPVQLGGITARVTFDGSHVSVEGYLHTYRQPDGRWQPFFVRSAGGAFRTAPEDGTPIVLAPGDELVSGRSVYVFEA